MWLVKTTERTQRRCQVVLGKSGTTIIIVTRSVNTLFTLLKVVEIVVPFALTVHRNALIAAASASCVGAK